MMFRVDVTYAALKVTNPENSTIGQTGRFFKELEEKNLAMFVDGNDLKATRSHYDVLKAKMFPNAVPPSSAEETAPSSNQSERVFENVKLPQATAARSKKASHSRQRAASNTGISRPPTRGSEVSTSELSNSSSRSRPEDNDDEASMDSGRSTVTRRASFVKGRSMRRAGTQSFVVCPCLSLVWSLQVMNDRCSSCTVVLKQIRILLFWSALASRRGSAFMPKMRWSKRRLQTANRKKGSGKNIWKDKPTLEDMTVTERSHFLLRTLEHVSFLTMHHLPDAFKSICRSHRGGGLTIDPLIRRYRR